MKISLAWLFDHIQADWRSIDITHLVSLFNRKTAEIEGYYQVNVPVDLLAVGQIESIEGSLCHVQVAQWNQKISLPPRADAVVGACYLVIKRADTFSWATSIDLGGHKESMLSAIAGEPNQLKGSLKKLIEHDDWIIEVDNKSINHRPDLWSHRGIAREVAALLDLPLKPLESFLFKHSVERIEKNSSDKKTGSFSISLAQPALSKRFTGVQLPVRHAASDLLLLTRLARIDSKPIDAIVDLTNYVMFDIGQPMHAFDADLLRACGEKIEIRLAKNKEKITLLDGTAVELTPQDMVVTAGGTAVALAGIMGGLNSSESSKTKTIFLEAAHFDAAMIRKTAASVKKRTEASTRFEKAIDQESNQAAVLRFMELARTAGLIADAALKECTIISLGQPYVAPIIKIKHAFIEKSLGITIKQDRIINILESLAFNVSFNDDFYTVHVPSFRASKDIAIAQDIVEEIGRFIGYDTIATLLPTRFMAPFDLTALQRTRAIKDILAFGVGMHEVYNYALHDHEFLHTIGFNPDHAAQVLSPVSENWRLLVTTLIPGLFKNIADNAALQDQLNFFENTRIWHASGDTVREEKKLAGIFFDKQGGIDFYRAKAQLQKLFDALSCDVSFASSSAPEHPWYAPQQTAHIFHKGKKIGIAGMVATDFMQRIALGNAFVFELDAQFLIDYQKPHHTFVPVSKFQPVDRDVSVLIDGQVTVDQLQSAIAKADTRISSVLLRDIFQKPDWQGKRAITFRFIITDHNKVISKEESELIAQTVQENLKALGAHIR